jgi:hypothetical protein
MSEDLIRKTLFSAAKTALTSKVVAWPNKTLDPKARTTWYAVHYLPADEPVVTMGDGGENEVVGLLQVDVNVPLNSGEKATETALLDLRETFYAGGVLTHEGQDVKVTKVVRSIGRTVDAFFRTSLSIYFYGRYNRPA